MELKGLTMIGKRVLSTAIFLGIAGFAACSLFTQNGAIGQENTPVYLEATDDTLVNGMNFINRIRRLGPARPVTLSAEPAVILLDDWTYTGKPTTSSFH